MLFQLLEIAGNKAVEFDPDTQARLNKLQGRTLALQITTVNQTLYISSQAEGLEISRSEAEQVDVTLKASLSALFKIGRDGLDDAELEAGELEIIGDPLIGQRFAQLIAQLNVDWEALIAEQIGPAPAKTVTQAANSAKILAQQGRQQFHEFVIQSLKQNSNLFAEKEDVETVLADIQDVQDRVDALEKRLTDLLDRV